MLTRRRCVTGSIMAVVAVAAVFLVFATGAFSGSSPADKVVGAGDNMVVMAGPQTNATLLTAYMKTSKPTDLVLNVSLECTIETTVTNVGSSTELAQGQVRVWTEVDGQVVPITSISDPPQNTPTGGTVASDSAVFCERVHEVNFMPDTNNEMISQFQKTKNANAFNWLRFNVGAGDHTISVKADLNLGPNTAMASSRALVGNRTLVVTPTKMANNAVISNPGTG
jgi:amino acid transporter